MANKTKSTGYASSSKGKFKWGAFWTGLTVFVLVVAIIFTFIMVGSSGGKDWSFSRVFPKKGAGENQTQTDNVIIGESDNHGISLMSMAIPAAEYETYGVERSAVNAYTITATFTPADTTYQEVDYSLYFDTSTEAYAKWAEGKVATDYGTVTPSADGSKEAVVTVKQSFSAPLMVKAASRRNSSIYATVRADYVCVTLHVSLNKFPNVDDSPVIENFQWSNGTVEPDTGNTVTLAFQFGNYVKTNMQKYGYTIETFYQKTIEIDDWSSTFDVPSIREMLMELGGSAAKANPTAYWAAVGKSFLGNGSPENYEGSEICDWKLVGYTREYNGVTYGARVYDGEDITGDNAVEMEDWGGFETKAQSMGITSPDGGLIYG